MAFSDKDVKNLIMNGYQILRDTYEEIKRLNTLIETDEIDFSRDGLRQRIQNMSLDYSFDNQENVDPLLNKNLIISNVKTQKQEHSSEPSTSKNISNLYESKETKSQESEISENESEQKYINETEILKQYYKINALRPVGKMEPGRLPFRHDQLQKMKQYQKEWLKNPIPGEKNYRAERWEIRQKMAERDIPRLRVIERKQLAEKRDEFRI